MSESNLESSAESDTSVTADDEDFKPSRQRANVRNPRLANVACKLGVTVDAFLFDQLVTQHTLCVDDFAFCRRGEGPSRPPMSSWPNWRSMVTSHFGIKPLLPLAGHGGVVDRSAD